MLLLKVLVAVKVNSDNTKATILELNAQTDFVAKNENFLNLNTRDYISCFKLIILLMLNL
jgi:translation elongation factor EF-Ts